LRDERVAALLCDAPAVPLVAARRAGIPGLLLANFTWADIYAPYARVAGEHAEGLVANSAALIARPRPFSGPSLPCGWPGCRGRSTSAWSPTPAATDARSFAAYWA